jgi:ABC-type spermidine/putrescine transport system permease subunit I
VVHIIETNVKEKQKSMIRMGDRATLLKVNQLLSMEWLLLIIPLIYIILLLGIPLIGLLKLSIYDESGFTFQYFTRFFTQDVYQTVLIQTFKISLYVTLMCLFLGYPVAYLMTKMKSRRLKDLIFGIIFLSFWISLLVRTFSWMIVLRSNGFINQILMGLGVIDEPITMLHNTTGVVIGMTHILLPYMILVAYSGMDKIDFRLIQAAQGLGSSSIKAFWNVFLPLSLPGVISGSFIVFVMSLGYYITPALLGGSGDTMIGKLIADQVNVVLNWNFAAAISVVLLLSTIIILGISSLFAKNIFSKGGN